MLATGEVVARAKGRMEFGARALGNRSILADPTRKDVVRIINDMIKSRDFWMPFAPAILAEDSDDYIHNPRGMRAPYMIMTFDTKRPDDFPAAIQPYDRTARPQIVYREHNPELHRLISRFRDKTGRAVVLNTSFNLHGYPIVASAADALAVLDKSGLEHLAVGDYLISKPR
jgi:carbamoyltransferase